MSNETIAWKICYTDNGQYRTVLSKHNSVGDYRAIDPMASSIALCAAPVSAEPTDDEIIDMAVEPLGIDCDRMPYGVIVFARTLLSRYSAAPVAAQAQQYASGGNLADRLDGLADTASPGSQMQSDLYAAATIWRKHLKGPAAQQPVSGADGLPHAMLPARPEPEASNTFGLGLDGYTGAQMLTYGRACAEAQRKADSQAKLSGNTGQLDHLPDATKMIEPSGNSGELAQAFAGQLNQALKSLSPKHFNSFNVRTAIQDTVHSFTRVGHDELAKLTESSSQQDADPLQGAADWLVQAITDCKPQDLQNRLAIGYNRASRLIDAARKEPGQ